MNIDKNASCVDVKEKVKTFIIENFLLGEVSQDLEDSESFFEKGIVDSTGVMELVSFIEKSFGIKFEDEELVPDNLDSLNKISDFVARKTC